MRVSHGVPDAGHRTCLQARWELFLAPPDPAQARPFWRSGLLVVALRARDPARAQFLASQLTAHSDHLFHRVMNEPEPDLAMSRCQLDGIFRESLLAHLDKLDRVAAAERAEPGFDPESSRRTDRRMGWILRILGARGAAAAIDDPLADEMRRDGLDDADIEESRAMLAAMVRQNGHMIPRVRLEGLRAIQAVARTTTNPSLAREAAFRGMSSAAFATERRYDGLRIGEVPLRDAILLRDAREPPDITGSVARGPGASAGRRRDDATVADGRRIRISTRGHRARNDAGRSASQGDTSHRRVRRGDDRRAPVTGPGTSRPSIRRDRSSPCSRSCPPRTARLGRPICARVISSNSSISCDPPLAVVRQEPA